MIVAHISDIDEYYIIICQVFSKLDEIKEVFVKSNTRRNH